MADDMSAPIDARKVGGWAGIGATVVLVASMFTVEPPPGMRASAQEIKDYLLDNRAGGNASLLLTALALPLLLFFLAGLRERLSPPGTEGWLAEVSTRCGGFFALGLAIGNACFYSATWTDETAGSAAATFRVTWDLGYLVFFVLFPLLATLVAGTGVAALRSGLLPAWWAWLGIILGVALVIGTVSIVSYTLASISFPVFLGFMIWLLSASIVMVKGDRPTPTTQES